MLVISFRKKILKRQKVNMSLWLSTQRN